MAPVLRSCEAGQEVEKVSLHAVPERVAHVLDPELCKPGDNEIYRRFQSFLRGGPRTVIPDQKLPHCSRSPARVGSPNGAQLPYGTRVQIQHLQSKPELNGQLGVIHGFDQTSDRYEVCLDNGQSKRVRRANLQAWLQQPVHNNRADEFPGLEPGMLVHVRDIPDHCEVSRREGSLLQCDTATGNWQVLMSDGGARWIRPQFIKPMLGLGPEDGGGRISQMPSVAPLATASLDRGLQNGVRVEVMGLKSRSDINGQCGTLVCFIEAEGRWQVCMDDGSGKAIAPENLQLCPQSANSAERPPAKLASGAQVRIKGLSIRPDLDGAEGRLISFDNTACRWVVEVHGVERKLREENLQVTFTAPVPIHARSQVSLEFEDSATADELLAVCRERRSCLSVADIAMAIRRIALCSDCSITRGDERFTMLVAQLRTLLVEQTSPKDIVDVLNTCRESDLQDPLLFDVLAQCAQQQVREFLTHEVVQLLSGFALAGHAPVALFDTLATQLLRSMQELCAREALLVAEAFAHVKLRHFELLDELGNRAMAQLDNVTDDELTQGISALQDMDALSCDLLSAVTKEVALRSTRLTLSQVAALAQALLKAAVLHGLGAAVESTLRELEHAADRLLLNTDLNSLEPPCIAALFDAFPRLHETLKVLVCSKAQQAVTLIGNLQSLDADAVCKLSEMFCTRALGAVGVRSLLAALGIRCTEPGFRQRAINRLCWAASCVEDWNVRTVPHRQFACAEFDLALQLQDKKVTEGSLVCHGDEHNIYQEDELPDNHVFELLGKMVNNRLIKISELDPLHTLLVKLFARCRTSCRGLGLETSSWKHLEGSVQVLLTEGSGLLGLLALRHLQFLMPKVVVSLSIVGDEQAVDLELSLAQRATASDEEVIDCEFADDEVVDVDEGLDAEIVD